MKKVLLYSGGMDSWLIDKLWKPDVKLFFNIGTNNSNNELERVKRCNDVTIIDLPLSEFEQPNNNYFLPLRNLHFITYAAHYGDVICLGATGSSTHKDKNEVFTTLSENVINYLLSEDSSRTEPVRIVTPFKNMSKTLILSQYLREGGDINKCFEETFSCYNPDKNGKPCMKCSSCLSKFTAFYNNGYQFDKEIQDMFVKNALDVMNSGVKDESYRLALKLKYAHKTICIDFDNTITTHSHFPETGNIRDYVKPILDELHNAGYYLILYTSRQGIDFDNCRKICEDHGLYFDEYLHKVYASYYVDDKAFFINSEYDWNRLRRELL